MKSEDGLNGFNRKHLAAGKRQGQGKVVRGFCAQPFMKAPILTGNGQYKSVHTTAEEFSCEIDNRAGRLAVS